MIGQGEIDLLKSLPIKKVMAQLGMKENRHGYYLCPAHEEKEPSLKAYQTTNTFYCFGCRSHGNVIDIVKAKLGITFPDACRWLEKNFDAAAGTECERRIADNDETLFDAEKYRGLFENPVLNEAARRFLFGERRLAPEVVEQCRISSWIDRHGTPLLQIPYYDTDGRLTGIQWRNLSRDGPRFRFPKGSQSHLYNLPIVRHLEAGETLYIAEGPSDCWSLLSGGHKAIAVPSATLLNHDDLRQLREIDLQLSPRWNMIPDNDMAGDNLYRTISSHIPVVRHQLPAWCKDYSDYYIKTLNNNII